MLSLIIFLQTSNQGSGCGSVDRAVTCSSRGPRFESNHQQKFILNIYCQLYRKDENEEKEAGNGSFKKQTSSPPTTYVGIPISNIRLNLKYSA